MFITSCFKPTAVGCCASSSKEIVKKKNKKVEYKCRYALSVLDTKMYLLSLLLLLFLLLSYMYRISEDGYCGESAEKSLIPSPRPQPVGSESTDRGNTKKWTLLLLLLLTYKHTHSLTHSHILYNNIIYKSSRILLLLYVSRS